MSSCVVDTERVRAQRQTGCRRLMPYVCSGCSATASLAKFSRPHAVALIIPSRHWPSPGVTGHPWYSLEPVGRISGQCTLNDLDGPEMA